MTITQNFQALAGQQGREFAAECVRDLTRLGFVVRDQRLPIADCGVEVDLVIENQHGIAFFAECKGSFRNRPGLQRTDTLKKAIANMFLLDADGYGPLLILTSHRPLDGAGVAMLRVAQRACPFEVLVPRDDFKRLKKLVEADDSQLRRDEWNFNRRLL